jgi:hypothetical protein
MDMKVSFKGQITGVWDWKPYCWDVLIDDGECALAVEFPRDKKPKEGESVECIKGVGVRWKGYVFAVDVRCPRIDDNGELYFT